ncbi:hypothetical protein B0H14DRAFT_2593136 [Mycena olivaceomarginata]|nr:hypothetical protein B0H14DRAFT_2593136 [Mycena olivaceomarginata]
MSATLGRFRTIFALRLIALLAMVAPNKAAADQARWNRIHIFRRLERTIFKVAALARPTTIPILMLVAGRVKYWVEPLLYRIIITAYPRRKRLGFLLFDLHHLLASNCEQTSEFLNSVKHHFLDSVQLSHLETIFWPRFAALSANTTLECIVFFVIDKTESANSFQMTVDSSACIGKRPIETLPAWCGYRGRFLVARGGGYDCKTRRNDLGSLSRIRTPCGKIDRAFVSCNLCSTASLSSLAVRKEMVDFPMFGENCLRRVITPKPAELFH